MKSVRSFCTFIILTFVGAVSMAHASLGEGWPLNRSPKVQPPVWAVWSICYRYQDNAQYMCRIGVDLRTSGVPVPQLGGESLPDAETLAQIDNWLLRSILTILKQPAYRDILSGTQDVTDYKLDYGQQAIWLDLKHK